MTGRAWHLGRLSALLGKEFRQMLRDPRSRRMLFISPVVQLLLFGYAVTTDVRHTRTFLVDLDGSRASRELVDALTAGGYFDIVARGQRPAEISRALDRGDAVIGVEVPRGFAKDLGSGRQAAVQLLADGSTANTANVALGYAVQIIARFGAARGADVAARIGAAPSSGGLELRPRAWYNPNLESQVYNVPAVMGNIVMLMSLLLTALAVVREREIGTLEQLMVSPLKPTELIIGKTLPSVAVASVDLLLVMALALGWFGIPFRGSFLLLVVASMGYIITGLGVGLLISTVSNTQQEAFMSMFLFFLPAMMLSGMMFPVENMPPAMQYLALLDPIRHYLVVVRSVFLKGTGWWTLRQPIVALFIMGITALWVAAGRFRKTVR